jgi:8-oxo-dGTP diphosphatase
MVLQVGVKALIKNSSDKYLLLQRSKIMDGEVTVSWDIPGGRIMPDEALHEALTRELGEEIGLRTVPDPQLIAAQDIFVKNKDLHVVRLTYRVSCDFETIRLSDEHSDYRWVSPHEIKSMVIEPYLKEVLLKFM